MSLDPVQIGRYRVLGPLGQGAQGMVYLAEDPLLKRGVAIKVMRASLADEEVLARFRREAEISAKLSHPNLITIFDVGEEPRFGPFLAMEFVDGQGLAERMKEGQMSPEEAMSMLLQAAEAIEAIHRAGIVHRDVKPSNFMVTKDGRLKLMDFGVAKTDLQRLTTTAAFLGTPAYAAPEALAADGRPGESADHWALAVTAFELLTGFMPFQGESVGAALYRIVHEPPRFPDGMGSELRAVFSKAFAKEPKARYSSLRAFLKELALVVDLSQPTRNTILAQLEGAAFTSGYYPLRGRKGFSRRQLWAGLAGLAIVAVGGIFLWWRVDATRALTLDSNPSGARVLLNGVEVGYTPLPHLLARGGARNLRLEKPGYLPLERELGADDAKLDLTLTPVSFKVSITSDPAGAEVFMDGQSLGHAPCLMEVPGEGRHVLEVKSDGYQTWTMVASQQEMPPNPVRLIRLTRPSTTIRR